MKSTIPHKPNETGYIQARDDVNGWEVSRFDVEALAWLGGSRWLKNSNSARIRTVEASIEGRNDDDDAGE